MMKKLILGTFVLLMTMNVSAQKINWITFEEAVALQKKEPKKIMMDMYTAWCGPCIYLDKYTFQNPDVAAYVNENYYAVKFNAEGNSVVNFMGNTFENPGYDPAKAKKRNSPHQFARFFEIRSYPTILFFDESTKLITPVVGYQKAQQLELYLKLFKNDDYKKMTSQEQFNAYYEAFKPVFKELPIPTKTK